MSDSAIKTGQSVLKKFTHESGKLCRVATRRVKLFSIRRQRKHYFQNLGERLYIFKVLQKEDNVWDKEEISQLLLTLSDLDQEQELLLQEINEIKTEEMAATEAESCTETFSTPENPGTVETPVADSQAPGDKSAAKTEESNAAAADSPADKPVKKSSTIRKTTTKAAASTAEKPRTTTLQAPRKKPVEKTTASETEKK